MRELSSLLDYAESVWNGGIGLFAVSLGAYLSLLACRDRAIDRAWFLSPVVDLARLTLDMMGWFQISESRLERERRIPTPMGQTLDWDDYRYVCQRSVDHWPIPTEILRGSGDTLCAEETVTGFAKRFGCRVRTVEGAGHWFHTPEELDALSLWLQDTAFVR